jgi:hypothetical protein
MRKILLAIALLVVLTMLAAGLWVFKGRQISAFADRYGIFENPSEKVTSVGYEGTGTGGVLIANQVRLYLDDVVVPAQRPSTGLSKDGKLALAAGGKVFSLGSLPPGSDDSSENLTAAPDKGDDATLTLGYSRLSWPTPFEVNFMTGTSPSWKRHTYQRLTWIKPNGSKLEMLWRYEQYYYKGNGWASPTMTHEGETGLVKIEIKP